MTREEQIWNEACHRYADSKMRNAFVAAAIWADQHPNWIDVKDDLPKHNVEERIVSFSHVLVCLYDGYRTESYYDDVRGKWGDYDGEVEYWMPMPKAPTKEE